MLYCEQCRTLLEARCQTRGHTTRSVREGDAVLLYKGDNIQAGMLEEMLRTADIPFLKEGKLGAAMTTWTGPMMEEYSFYVPYTTYERAAVIADVLRPVEEGEATESPEETSELEEFVEMEFLEEDGDA